MAPSPEWVDKDFYAALGVTKNASDAEIKKAYKSYARKYHPDRNPGDRQAEEKFKAATEAFQVLSKPEDRKQYDLMRESGSPFNFADFGFGSQGFGAQNFNSQSFSGQSFGGDSQGYEDIFSRLFGGQQSGFKFNPFGPSRGDDVQAKISIPLRKAISGTTVSVTSSGQKVTAKIPAGIMDGQKVRVKGKGRPGSHGGEAGDLLVTVSVEKHPVYELEGKDVYVNVPISFPEAAMGATIEVPTITGEQVRVKVPQGSSSDKLLRVRGKGFSNKSGAGDMYVRLKVVVPKRMTAEAQAAVEQFAQVTSDADPRREFSEMAKV